MSLSSKIPLVSGGYLRFEVDIDPLHCSDAQWAFILAIIQTLRDYERTRPDRDDSCPP